MEKILDNITDNTAAEDKKIPYNILTSRYKDVEFKIDVDYLPELKHPKFLLVGGGLAIKYTKYLEKELFNNLSLLRRFVSIAKLGSEKGTIALVCNCKIGKKDNRAAHSEVIKYILLKYHETLIKLLPYLFKNESDVEKSDEEIEEDLKMLTDTLKIQLLNNLNTNKMLSSGSIKNLEKLSPEDKEQIKELLLQQITDEAVKNSIKDSNFDDLIGVNKDNEVTYEEPLVNKEDLNVSEDRGNTVNVSHVDENPFIENSVKTKDQNNSLTE